MHVFGNLDNVLDWIIKIQHHNMWDSTKTVLRGKLKALKTYIVKKKKVIMMAKLLYFN